jgi:transcriptional regulator with XRE-family HTH domain
MKLGKAIRDLRGNWSQKLLASNIGVHWTTVARLESGKHQPSAKTLLLLAGVADATDRADLGTVFHEAAQADIGVRETSLDTLVLTDADEVRIAKAAIHAWRYRPAPVEKFLADDIAEVERGPHERRRAQRIANQIVREIRAGKSDREVAYSVGTDISYVRGYRDALKGEK